MEKDLRNNLILIQKPSDDERKLQKNYILSHHDAPDHHINQHKVSSGKKYGSQNQTAFYPNFENVELNTLFKDSVCIHSSTSSSSTSWFSESSIDSEWNLLLNKPKHSVSCSNLPEARIFQDKASMYVDFKLNTSELCIQQKQRNFGHFGSRQQVSELGLKKSPLHSCQSKSVEGLLQSITQERNQLHKTTSLGETGAVRKKVAATVNMAKPHRAVSSIQLPSKGILKNKDKRQKHKNVQKGKSMEALNTKEQSTSSYKQSSVEALRKNFLKEKVEFSAFLDEITRQVISPSKLSSFRINPSIAMTSHRLPIEKRKQSAKAKFNQELVDVQKLSQQQNVQPLKFKNEKEVTDSSKHKHQSGSYSGVPHNPQYQCQQEKQCYTSRSYRTMLHKNHLKKYIQSPDKGNSTSPESILKEKHNHTKGKQDYKYSYGISRELNTKHKVASLPAGLDIRCRRHSRQSHRDSVTSLNRAEYLEQDGKDLHENLLQIMSCIANVKAELLCIMTELGVIDEKCKKLEENYTNCQQSKIGLQQQPQSVLSDKHFDSEDDVKDLFLLSSSCNQLNAEKSSDDSRTLSHLQKKGQ